MTTCGTRMSPASGIHPSCRFNPHSNAPSATNPSCRSGGGLDWEMLALCIFLVFSFAALVFAICLIWAKCESPSGF